MISSIVRVLAAALVGAALAVPAAAGPSDLSAEMREALGLRSTKHGWEYRRNEPMAERHLTAKDLARLEPFLAKLAAAPTDATLAGPLVDAIRDGADAARRKTWFAEPASYETITAEGRRAVIGVLLGEERAEARQKSGLERRPAYAGQFVIPIGEPAPGAWSKASTALDHRVPANVDWDGDRRGWAMPGADARVMKPGETEVGLHFVSSNYIYGEDRGKDAFWIRYEGETAGLDVRRGVRLGDMPVEIGARVKVHKDAVGFQNGLIEWVETKADAQNKARFGTPERPPLPHGSVVRLNGQTLHEYDGKGSSFGDVYLTVKTALSRGEGLHSPTAAFRLAANLATAGANFTRGNYVGAGLSVSQRFSQDATVNLDLRVTKPLDSEGMVGLPLRAAVRGATLGLNYALSDSSSFILQFDMNQSPYKDTGLPVRAIDGYNDGLTIGWNKVFKYDDRTYMVQVFGRENILLNPFRFVGSLAPDFQIGVSLTSKF